MTTVTTIDLDEKAMLVALRESKVLADRLQSLLRASGLSARAVSKQAGLGDTYVNDVLTKKNCNPSIPAVQAIARVLGTTVAFLVGEINHPITDAAPRDVNLVPMMGIIESGAFRKVKDGDSFTMVQRPLSQAYPKAKHFTLAVGDDSMNVGNKEGPILPGMEVLCVDLISADLTVESDKIYAVRRTLDGGLTYETIIRRAMVFRDRTELLAESNKPGYEKIVIAGRLGVDPQRPIFAFGLVYAIFRAFA